MVQRDSIFFLARPMLAGQNLDGSTRFTWYARPMLVTFDLAVRSPYKAFADNGCNITREEVMQHYHGYIRKDPLSY